MIAPDIPSATLRSLRDASAVARRVDVGSDYRPVDAECALNGQDVQVWHPVPLRDAALGHPDRVGQRLAGPRSIERGEQSRVCGISAARGAGRVGHARIFRTATGSAQDSPNETNESVGGMRIDMPSHTRITEKRLAIGRRIRSARIQVGLSQSALATRLDLSSGAITQWETGRAMPEPDKFKALAEALGVEPGWLLTGDEPDEIVRAQTTSEQEMLVLMRKIGPDEQAHAIHVMKALSSTPAQPARARRVSPKI